jgi:hypothetical protein
MYPGPQDEGEDVEWRTDSQVGCLPRHEWWKAEYRRATDHANPARGQGADGRGSGRWLAVRRRQETGERRSEEQERSKIRGTQGKVAVTGRLSVPQQGTTPSIERGDEIEADIVRFSDDAGMDRYMEPYWNACKVDNCV